MATDNTVGGLSLTIGLDTTELDLGFQQAEKTVKMNLDRLNREENLIKLRAQIELNNLDDSASSFEKIKIQEDAFNKQIEIQQEKINTLTNAYEELSRTRGINAESTQQLALQLEMERLSLSNLEKQTRDLSKQQEIAFGINYELLALIEPAIKGIDALIAAGHAIPIPHAKVAAAAAIGLTAIATGSAEATEEIRENNPAKVLDEEFQIAEENISDNWSNIIDDAENSTSEITSTISDIGETLEENANTASDFWDLLQSDDVNSAIEKTNKLLEGTDSIIAKIALSMIGMTVTVTALEGALIKAAKPAIENFQELKKTANELNLPLERTNELVSKIKLSGADLNDVRDYVRGVQDAVIKGDSEDPEVIALTRYGVAIQDTQGKLLSFDATLEELYQGYLKARAAGEAESYVIMTNGQAVQDVLPYFENLAKAEENMEKIQWSSLDSETLKQALENTRLLEIQTEEFKNSLSSLAVPAANIALNEVFEMFREGTKIIEENRDEIIYWSFVLMEGIKTFKSFGVDIGGFVAEKILTLKDSLAELNEELGITNKIKDVFNVISGDVPEDNIFSRAKKATEEFIESNEKAKNSTEKLADEISNGLSYSYNRIAKYKEELGKINLDLKFGNDDYSKSIAEIELWQEKALQDARYYKEEQNVIYELSAAKLKQIEQRQAEEIAKAQEESAQRTQDYLQSAADIEYGLTHSAFEKQLYDIERWKEAQLEKATIVEETAAIEANAVAKVSEAIQNEVDRIKELTQSLEDEIFEMENSRYEADKRRALQKAQKALDEGVDSDTVQRWLSDKLGLLKKQAREDKSGNYTKSPTDRNYSGDVQIIDFGEKQNKSAIELFTDENKIRERLNVQLADSTQKVISAQDLLAKNTLKNADIEIIEGDRTVQSLNDTTRGIIDANKTLTDITKNFADMDYLMAKLPDYTQGIIDAMSSGHIQKNSGSYSADSGYIADLANFSTILKQAGLSTEEIYSYLDRMNNVAEQSLQDSYSGLREELAANIADEISNAVTNAVGQASNIDADNGKAQSFSDSVQKVTDANNQLAQSTNSTAENLNQSSKVFELILGDRLITAQKSLADATNQIAQDTLKNAVNPVIPKIAETPDTSEITNFQSKITEMIAELDKSMIAIRESSVSFESVISATARSSEEVSNALHITATAIEETSQKIASIEFNIPQPVISNQNNDERQDKLVNTALDSTQTLGQMVQLGGMATAQPEIVLIGTVIDILSDIAGKIYNLDGLTPTQETAGMNQLQTPTLDIQPLIVEVQAIKSSIDRFQPQQPNITVSPSINIDLGGAYVFDDSMKKQLTDDITNDVVNAVTETVEQAKSTVNYGYGN